MHKIYCYYIGVMQNGKMSLVTGVNLKNRTWEVSKDGIPKEFPKQLAEEIAEGMFLNGVSTSVIRSYRHIDRQLNVDRSGDEIGSYAAQIGFTAGYMDATNLIKVGGAVADDDDLGKNCVELAKKWLNRTSAEDEEWENFDFFKEEKLRELYEKDKE